MEVLLGRVILIVLILSLETVLVLLLRMIVGDKVRECFVVGIWTLFL